MQALHVHHAYDLVYRASLDRSRLMTDSGWIILKQHASREEAVTFHLHLTKDFIPGGSPEELDQGVASYETLYALHCPKAV